MENRAAEPHETIAPEYREAVRLYFEALQKNQ
jgi:hypothetical protein